MLFVFGNREDGIMSSELLSSPLSTLEFTALDLETTGLYPENSEILEIGALRFNRDSILSEYRSFLKPKKPIPLDATKVNGITFSMVQHSPTPDLVLKDFFKFSENSILIIQNAAFDLSFLLAQSDYIDPNFLELPVICTVQISRKVFPSFQKYNLNALRMHLKIPPHRMRTELSTGIHEALDDSFAAMEVFKRAVSAKNAWENPFSEFVHHEKGFKIVKDYRKGVLAHSSGSRKARED